MSSDFRLICVSHTPALVVEYADYANVRNIISDLTEHEQPAIEHRHCDLVVGRWSGDLIEIGCLPSNAWPPHGHTQLGHHPTTAQPTPPQHSGWHRDMQWAEAAWLRLMLMTSPEQHAAARVPGCWPISRVEPLRRELGLEAHA